MANTLLSTFIHSPCLTSQKMKYSFPFIETPPVQFLLLFTFGFCYAHRCSAQGTLTRAPSLPPVADFNGSARPGVQGPLLLKLPTARWPHTHTAVTSTTSVGSRTCFSPQFMREETGFETFSILPRVISWVRITGNKAVISFHHTTFLLLPSYNTWVPRYNFLSMAGWRIF